MKSSLRSTCFSRIARNDLFSLVCAVLERDFLAIRNKTHGIGIYFRPCVKRICRYTPSLTTKRMIPPSSASFFYYCPLNRNFHHVDKISVRPRLYDNRKMGFVSLNRDLSTNQNFVRKIRKSNGFIYDLTHETYAHFADFRDRTRYIYIYFFDRPRFKLF